MKAPTYMFRKVNGVLESHCFEDASEIPDKQGWVDTPANLEDVHDTRPKPKVKNDNSERSGKRGVKADPGEGGGASPLGDGTDGRPDSPKPVDGELES